MYYRSICLLLLFTFAAFAKANSPNVLVLYSTGNDSGFYTSFNEELRAQIYSQYNNPKIFTEYLDLYRFDFPQYKQSIRTLIIEKYKSVDIDAIVFDSSLTASVFSDEPQPNVFAKANKFVIEILSPSPMVDVNKSFSISFEPNYKKLATAILEITEKETVYVLVKSDENYANITNIIRQQTNDVDLNIEFIDFVSTGQTINQLAVLDANAPLVITPFYASEQSRVLNPVEITERLARLVSQPVFVTYDMLVTENVVGGYVLLSDEAAKLVAQQISRAFEGYQLENHSFTSNAFMFNYNALEIHRIDHDKLPDPHRHLNKQQDFWDLFLGELLYLIVIVATLAGLVVFMLHWNRLLRLNQKELSQSQARLSRINERMDAATDATNIGVWEYDLQRDNLFWDKAMMVHHDIAPESFNGSLSRWYECLGVKEKLELESCLNESMQSGKPWKLSYTVELANGESNYLDCHITCVKNEQLNVIRLVGTVLNVTDSVLYQQKLQLEREKAERATKAKSEFLANMSHEIRTPMNGVIGAADLLAHTPLDKIQAKYANMIKSSASGLLNILNDILDLSKIESGKLDIQAAPMNLKKLVQQTISAFRLEITRKKLKFKLIHPSYIPEITEI